MPAKPKPGRYRSVTPSPVVDGASRGIDFNQWWIATHKEDVSPDELQRRAKACYARQNRP